MYIPSLLFGGANSCISASGADSSGTFLSGSQVWEYYKYSVTGSGSFTITQGSTIDARIFIVAGGGGGGITAFNGESLNESAGGGGAGGVVYNTFRIGQGTYPLYVGDGGAGGVVGEESWVKFPFFDNTEQIQYITSGSRLTAEGGGFGAWFTSKAGPGASPAKTDAAGGGSGGGGCASLRWVGGYIVGTYGGGRYPQGFDGGDADGTSCTSTTSTTATGGGGAGGASLDTDCSLGSSEKLRAGGPGEVYMVDGTNTEYAYGGAAMRAGSWAAATSDTGSQSTRARGAGGWATSDSYPATGGKSIGRPGEIVIMVPVCQLDLTECTEYTVSGGTGGGNFTYIPCGENSITSSVVVGGYNQTICSYPVSLPSAYPSASGDVNYVAEGACNSYTPPTPTPTPAVPCDCRTITFTAGSGGGTSSHYPCGIAQPSYNTPGSGSVLTTLSGSEEYTTCMVSGSYYSITGFESSVAIWGTCTSSLPLCNP
tara:strand:+ start:375 stop:1826 length:1452 start_codon:yes stop_codon:yes gene_type:complete